jgi:hypothetical protein
LSEDVSIGEKKTRTGRLKQKNEVVVGVPFRRTLQC